jgi:hypothetical protein
MTAKKATRKKAERKKITRKKATRKKATRKKADRKKATRKKATRRKGPPPRRRQPIRNPEQGAGVKVSVNYGVVIGGRFLTAFRVPLVPESPIGMGDGDHEVPIGFDPDRADTAVVEGGIAQPVLGPSHELRKPGAPRAPPEQGGGGGVNELIVEGAELLKSVAAGEPEADPFLRDVPLADAEAWLE